MRTSVIALICAALTGAAVPGMAAAATRTFPVPGFVKLRVEGPYNVRVRTGAKAAVNARGPQSRIDKLIVEPRGDTLVVTTEKSWNWGGMKWSGDDTVYVDITVPMLTGVTLAGSGDVTIDRIRTATFSALLTGSGDLSIGRLDSSRLSAGVTGSGDLTLAGKTGKADASVRGSGDLRATGLAVDLLTASVAGSGDISVGPTRVAKASVVGSGDIHVGGRSSCTKSKVGSGDIYCGS